ncbi:MAG: transcription antitermination factor NusB [Nitriliruptoraceae bacterium]
MDPDNPPHAPRRGDTADPSRSRERALRVLFQADVRGVDPSITLERLESDADARAMLDEATDLISERELLAPEQGAGGSSTAGSRGGGTTGPRGSGTARPRGGGTARPSGSGTAGPSVSGWSDAPSAVEVPPLDGFTQALVLGVARERSSVETLIGRFARRWAISRMPVVDRNVLRLATYELLYESTPPAVVIDEAIRLAKRLSTDDSGRYVNGVLESIRREIEAERASAQGPVVDPDPDDGEGRTEG